MRATSGWRRHALAAGLGALSILAMAPFHLSPVLLVTLAGLVWLTEMPSRAQEHGGHNPSRLRGMRRLLAAPILRDAAPGWWFGFGYHLFGLFWIGEAFLVEAETFAVLMPFAVTLMPAGLALFWGGATAAAVQLSRPGEQRVLALAVTLALAEWLRGHVFTGFPWNIIGYALTWPLPMMQLSGIVGIYGLTLIAVLLFAAPAVVAGETHARGTGLRRAALSFVLPVAALPALGGLLLHSPAPAPASVTRVRLVQPSILQREKWMREHQARIFDTHLSLSLRSASGVEDGADGVHLIVWPEAAMPFLPLRSPSALAAIGRMLPVGSHLAAGALRIDEATADAPPGQRRVYNSLLVFAAGGSVVAAYDKIHLVPFGEYLPLQATLEAMGFEQLTRLRGGFTSGQKPRPLLSIPGVPLLGPLVCYEAIFPAAVVQGDARPAALINVTNDGWFGNTTGPRQHLHQARVRAVEEGLPLLRSANNGISAVIDANGRILASLGMNEIGVIDSNLPPARPPPIYARLGDTVFWLLLLAAAGLLGYRRMADGSARR